MTIFEEPPDENQAYEPFDEALDNEDIEKGNVGGPEGQRDLDTELVVDDLELEQAGANLDDPEQMSLLDGNMDDPDGINGSVPRARSEIDDIQRLDGVADDLPEGALEEDDIPGLVTDPALEEILVDPMELIDKVPDDAPGPDSARW